MNLLLILSAEEITIIKNASFSTCYKKTNILGVFKIIIPSTFIYKPILIKIYKNANIMKTQFYN